ncbi:M24 family metallopeptidase [Candidatus Formimonas warabiya]|uniref:Aminopeptidase P family protein n=1 Tax=Formimonas warabiya TaxID=1761012 RepID=A0A3G1KRW5_FORW1|nr:Xaa-Pro peptidase family protein [Candidatus Formimonas warabiya]ATW25180.1 hypothetical protein DCMF_10725 [Candidatus Formimonas warabiya]
MERIDRVIKSMEDHGVDSLLIMKDANLRYVSHFTGSESYLIITAKKKILITDSRYTEQAEQECPGFEIVRYRHPFPSLEETLKTMVSRLHITRLGFEKDYLTFDGYENISHALPDLEFVPTLGIVESVRSIKDPHEIDFMKRAAHIADMAFTNILKYVHIGITEKDIETELEYVMKRQGAFSTAFPTIVASGPRSSLPHGVPSQRQIQYGDLITLDFGALYEGYRSDMTRTVAMGKADAKQKQIYDLVLYAQKEGVQAISAGIKASQVDHRVRNIIKEAGYGEFFSHGLGHGVGLEIHEAPSLNSRNEEILVSGNVVTVEPGIYLPNWGGVRIEDTVLVTERGCEVLTHAPKELMIL